MEGKKFFDIHCHAMNLSHPYLLAFLRRLNIPVLLVLNSLLGPFTSVLLGKQLNKVNNLLALMENDIGNLFLTLEQCLIDSGLFRDGHLHVGGTSYNKVVLTPLMMDFGYKGTTSPDIHYNKPSEKPIVEQVIDVFNGIRNYRKKTTARVFEIYPFLGINTANYPLEDQGKNTIPKMLDKYFSDYAGSNEALFSNMGNFDGNIDNMSGNYFSGIKLYPPLGFDPWPEDNGLELEKVKCLYHYCCDKKIPLTVHCSDGGFVVTDKAKIYTSPARWAKVLYRYPKLKLNLGHFGNQSLISRALSRVSWEKQIISLIERYENVYTDFSCRGLDIMYYTSLKELVDSQKPALQRKLRSRILFGSDFMINLLWIDSYSKYLEVFSETNSFTGGEKDLFCSVNPARFLFED